MKRVLVLAVAMTGLVLPAAANAGTFQGVVIAKSAKRKAIVTASANGTVRTIRAPKTFGKLGLGALVTVRARQLPDSTFAAAATQQIGRGKRARVQATVVKRAGQKLYLSAGNSVFVFGLRTGAGSKLRPGDRVTASASFGKAQLFCDTVKPVGHDDELELEGIYLSTEGGVLSLAVHGRGLVKVSVPDGFDLPELKPGDEVSLQATVESDGTFTLASIDNEDAGDESTGGDDGVDMGDHIFTVSGLLSALSSTSVGVEVDGHPEPVRCAVPASASLTGFTVGQAVEMSCKYAEGDFVLVKLTPKTEDPPGSGEGSVDVEGSITTINPTVVTVAVTPPPGVTSVKSVMCVLQAGEDLRGFAVGDAVELQCDYSKTLGHYVLTSLTSDNASLDDGYDGLTGWFDLTGVLASIRSDGVGIKVVGHTSFVNCAMPAGTDLSGFALGDAVEIECSYGDGRWKLASLSSDSAQVTLA
ncbi:MAG: hypothetical protein E6G19_07860 [Actinobacteria bacterium]|nr:MAG: hypothetical protein E6G19_07860 [Actinomycetota bacterium]